MKKFKDKLVELFPSLKTRAFKAGGYSVVATIIVLAILIMVNVLVRNLPTNLTQFDMSASKLYSVTADTKVVVNALEDDVTIYYICQAGEEDEVVNRLLERYGTLSEHLTVERKDPDAYPTFAANYYSGTVNNNSVVVECGDKYRYIDYNDMYVEDGVEYASYYANTTYAFDGEGVITSAINYVVSDDLPIIYSLEGHGEYGLSDDLLSSIEKANYEYQTLSLLSSNEVPEDCSCLMIISPTSDLSSEEVDLIKDYLEAGGKLFITLGPVEEGILENFNSIVEDYGVSVNEGIVIEGDSNSYAFGYPYILMPSLNEHDITSSLIEDSYYVIMPLCAGYTITDDTYVTSLMDTSSSAYSKVAGYNLETYEKEDGDIDGSFSLGFVVEDGDSKIVLFGSDYFLDDVYVSYSSGANEDLLMNSLSYLLGQGDSLAIKAKSLSYEYLTISDSTSSFLKILMLAVVPIIYLFLGILNLIQRRKL